MQVEPIRLKSKITLMYDVLKEQNDRNAMVFKFGINTILRVSDIITIKVSDVMDESGSIRDYVQLQEQKTSKYRKIRINAELERSLIEYIDDWKLQLDDWLFPSFRSPEKHIDRVTTWKFLKKASEEAQIENFGTHSMRKTLAYHIYSQTKNISLVMKMLNHTNPAVTMRYIGISQDMIDRAYEDFSL